MDFLEKLNYLMEKDKLNKSALSKSCTIPYTTIDGWYKKGYEGLKLTILRKSVNFFETTLDFWANNQSFGNINIENKNKQREFFDVFDQLSSALQDYLIKTARDLLEAH